MPLISIVVPIYNTQSTVERCISSIRNQTFEDFELILVNDGSVDLSGDICDRLSKEDERIRVIHKENGGLSSARNAGIEVAEGQYIAFVDSDDFIETDMYDCLIEAIERNQVPLAIAGRYVHDGNSVTHQLTLSSETIFSAEEALERLLTWNAIDSSACDKLFQRELFRNIRFPLGRYNEDIFIMSGILSEAGRVVHIGAPKYHYVYRQNSITQESFSPKKMDLLDATNNVLEFVQEKHPILKPKAQYFHASGIIYLYELLLSSTSRGDYLEYRKKLHRELSSYLGLLLFSKCTSPKQKISAFLLFLGVYSAVARLYRLSKRKGL